MRRKPQGNTRNIKEFRQFMVKRHTQKMISSVFRVAASTLLKLIHADAKHPKVTGFLKDTYTIKVLKRNEPVVRGYIEDDAFYSERRYHDNRSGETEWYEKASNRVMSNGTADTLFRTAFQDFYYLTDSQIIRESGRNTDVRMMGNAAKHYQSGKVRESQRAMAKSKRRKKG